MSGMSSSEDEAAVASPETRPSLSSDQTVSITASSSVDISDGAEPAQPKEPIAKLSGKYIDVNTVRAAGGSLAMAVLILPAEYKIVAKAKASAISVSELSPEDRMYEQKVSGYKKRKGIDEGVSESDAMRVIDFDYIPRSLSRGGMPALTPMIEAQLWLRGFLCNINSVIIKPEGYEKPLSIVAGRTSASAVNRSADVELDPPDAGQRFGLVTLDPLKKRRNPRSYHCCARILCFNPDLKLNHKSKFDIAVDKDVSTYSLEPQVYNRTLVGAIPRDKEGNIVDVVLATSNDYYQIDLNATTGTSRVQPIYDETTPYLETNSITINRDLRMKFRNTMTQLQNHDYFISFEGYHHESQLGGGKHQRDHRDGDSDDGCNDNDGEGSPKQKKQKTKSNQHSKSSSEKGRKRTIQNGNLS